MPAWPSVGDGCGDQSDRARLQHGIAWCGSRVGGQVPSGPDRPSEATGHRVSPAAILNINTWSAPSLRSVCAFGEVPPSLAGHARPGHRTAYALGGFVHAADRDGAFEQQSGVRSRGVGLPRVNWRRSPAYDCVRGWWAHTF